MIIIMNIIELIMVIFDTNSHVHDYDYFLIMMMMIEGSLEVKLPTIWKDEKNRWAESERREE